MTLLVLFSIQCSNNFSLSCGGSGLILYFSNLHNRTKVLRAHIILSTAYIWESFNYVPYGDVSIAGKVHTEEPKAIRAFFGGMTVMFSQGDYSTNVVLSNTYGQYIFGGLFSGMAFIFNDASVGMVSTSIKKVKVQSPCSSRKKQYWHWLYGNGNYNKKICF